MAGTKISGLADGGAIQAADQVPVNRGGTNYRAALGMLASVQDAVLPADVANSTQTLADATGLALTLAANAAYAVHGLLTLQSAATSTGYGLALDVPAGAAVSLTGLGPSSGGGVAVADSYADGGTNFWAASVNVANANVAVHVFGAVATGGTGGAAQLRFLSEVAGSAVTLKGGLCWLRATRLS
ncbi:MAG: hypothetical protein K2X87_25470 [Gemmataceae bacterium]|nr:hypothetical protein [Gemmataceae bacterium]